MSRPSLTYSVGAAHSPWYRTGERATKPSAPRRSHTRLICGTRPHHSCITMTPGPAPLGGVTKCPEAVEPLHGNSTVSPMLADHTHHARPWPPGGNGRT